MKTFIKKLKNIARRIASRRVIAVLGVCAVLFLGSVRPVGAIIPALAPLAVGAVGLLLGSVSSIWASAAIMGLLAVTVMYTLVSALVYLLIWLASYNSFGSSVAISIGWIVARDLANMFFIVVLLTIAIATILGFEKYEWKHHLPRLLIMAVLINFSKTISLLLIDVSQVVMLTFVSTFQGAAFNFLAAFNTNGIFNIAADSYGVVSALFSGIQLPLTMIVSALFLFLTALAIGAMVVILIGRIVTLWFLVVLSPIAYFMSTFPQGEKYHEEWWELFVNNLIVGPALAFFIWLSLQVMNSIQEGRVQALFGSSADLQSLPNAAPLGIAKIGTGDSLLSFVIALGLFYIGLEMAQKLATMGGGAAGLAIKGMEHTGIWTLERLDDMQAELQKSFANSKLGSKLVGSDFGKKLGLEKLKTHGVQMRILPEAWQAREHRVEEERIAEAAGVATDILNSALPLGRKKTDKTTAIRNARVKKAKKEEFEDVGITEEADVRHVIHDELVDEHGVVIPGREIELQAALEVMAKSHDDNEIAKDPHFAALYGTNQQMIGPETVVKIVRKAFRTEAEAARVAFNIGQIGFANGDASFYKMASRNIDTGEYEFVVEKDENGNMVPDPEFTDGRGKFDAKTHAKIAAAYIIKKPGRNAVQQLSRQDILVESTAWAIDPDTGKLVNLGLAFREMNDSGKENARVILGQYVGHYVHGKEETRNTIRENLDVLVDWYNNAVDGLEGERKLSDVEKDAIQQFIRMTVAAATGVKDASVIDGKAVQEFLKSTQGNEALVKKIKAISDARVKLGFGALQGFTANMPKHFLKAAVKEPRQEIKSPKELEDFLKKP